MGDRFLIIILLAGLVVALAFLGDRVLTLTEIVGELTGLVNTQAQAIRILGDTQRGMILELWGEPPAPIGP